MAFTSKAFFISMFVYQLEVAYQVPNQICFCTGNILNPMIVYQLKRYLLTASQPDHGFYQ